MTTAKTTKTVKAIKNEIIAAAAQGRVVRTAKRVYDENGYTDAQRRNTLAEMRGLVVYVNSQNGVCHLTTTFDMAVMPLEKVVARSVRDLAKQKTIAAVVPQDVAQFKVVRTGLHYSVSDAQGIKGLVYDKLQAAGVEIVGKRAALSATMPTDTSGADSVLAEVLELLGKGKGDAIAAELPEMAQA